MSRTSQQYYQTHVAGGAWDQPPEWAQPDRKRNDMKMTELYPSKFLKAGDVQDRDVTLTIKNVAMQTLKTEHGDEQKPVMTFQKTDKELVLNVTNGNTIADSYGQDSDDWIGKPVTLYATRVQFGSKMVDAIRVKMPAMSSAAPQPTVQNELNPPPMSDAEVSTGVLVDNADEPFNDDIPF